MMNLFTAFGLEEPSAEELKAKVETPKKKEETTKKKSGNNSSKAAVQHYPQEICTGFCVFHPEYEGGKTISELNDMFLAEYPGAYELCECGTASQIRIKMPGLYKRREALETTKLPEGVLVCFGQHQLMLKEECTVATALVLFTEQVPEFAGCKAYYNVEKKQLYPFHVVLEKEPAITFPCKIGYGDELVTITETPDDADFTKVVKKAYEKEYHVKISGIHYVEEVGHWVPVYENSAGVSTGTSGKTEVKEEKYPLPVKVRCFMQNHTFGSESFPDGATEVTAEQVRQALEKLYFEYSKERTKMEYDKTHNCFIPILKTSVKGSGERVENHGFATFTLKENKLTGFDYHLPKIPGAVLDELVEKGRKALPNEVMLQLFWDDESFRYVVFKPEQRACPTGVIIKRNMEMEQKYWLVADMHTHGNGSAFFSEIDDADEKGWRIFVVCGKLGENPEFQIRVGANGSFINVPVGDLFEGK